MQALKASRKGKSKDVLPSELAKDSQYQEFAQVMQSRKAGPSWANDERPQPTASTSAQPAPDSKKEAEVVGADEEPLTNDLSDLDWLKRHQKGNAPIPQSKELTVFDQSDEEILADESSDKEVRVIIRRPSKSELTYSSGIYTRQSGKSCSSYDYAYVAVVPSQSIVRMHRRGAIGPFQTLRRSVPGENSSLDCR